MQWLGRYLRERDGWIKPDGATDNTVQLMVQCMEAWFCSDKDCLEAYFGQGFNRNALPSRRNVEEIPKRDVLDGLEECHTSMHHQGRVFQRYSLIRDPISNRSGSSNAILSACRDAIGSPFGQVLPNEESTLGRS